MTQTQRNVLGIFLTVSFLITAPIIILYAMGYRVSRGIFQEGTPGVQVTGGLRVRTSLPYDVTVNNEYLNTSPLYRVGLPVGPISIKLDRDGFVPWEKQLSIQESTVTLVDKPILFPENPSFQPSNTVLENVDETFKSPTDTSIIFRIERNLYFLDESDSTPVLISTLQQNEDLQEVVWNVSNKSGILITSIDGAQTYFLFELTSGTVTEVDLVSLQSIFPYTLGKESVQLLEFSGSELFFEQGGHIRSYNFSLDELGPILVSDVDDAEMFGDSVVYLVEGTRELIQYDIRSEEAVSLAQSYDDRLQKYFTNAEDTLILTEDGVLQSFEVSTDEAIQVRGVDIVEYEITELPFDGEVRDFFMSVNDQKLLVFTNVEISIVYLDDFQTYTQRNRGDISTLYTALEGRRIEGARFMLFDAEYVMFLEDSILKVVELDDRNTPQVYEFGQSISFFDWETQGTNLVIQVVQEGNYGYLKFPFRRLLPLL
jgi:hypothetical protein